MEFSILVNLICKHQDRFVDIAKPTLWEQVLLPWPSEWIAERWFDTTIISIGSQIQQPSMRFRNDHNPKLPISTCFSHVVAFTSPKHLQNLYIFYAKRHQHANAHRSLRLLCVEVGLISTVRCWFSCRNHITVIPKLGFNTSFFLQYLGFPRFPCLFIYIHVALQQW